MKKQSSNKRGRYMINRFKYPSPDTIKGRTSTICRSMACTLVTIEPRKPEDEKIWLNFFNDKCAYCGDRATHLDHLFPLVKDKKPTGYGTGLSNLVPCCPKCNQPKGNRDWEEFMNSDDCNHVDEDKDVRINNIKEFQEKLPAKRIKIDKETEKKFEAIRDQFTKELQEAERNLLELKKTIMGKNA